MGLELAITTLSRPDSDGGWFELASVLEWASHYSGLEVSIAFGDLRTAGAQIPVYDSAADHLWSPMRALDRMLFVLYNDAPVFWGYVYTPRWDEGGNGLVNAQAIDPGIRLQRAFIRIGDDALELGVPIGPTGLERLLATGQNTPGQDALHWPGLGILTGDVAGDAVNLRGGDGVTVLRLKPVRGANTWEMFGEVLQKENGPEFEFAPRDVRALAGDGTYALMNIFARQGADRSTGEGAVVFRDLEPEDPENPNNAKIEVAPDGSRVRNFAVQIKPGYRALAQDDASRAEIGSWVDWLANTSDTAATDNVLMEYHTQASVRDLAYPPMAFTITPRLEPASHGGEWSDPLYLRDYGIGDVVGVAKQKGHLVYTGSARITNVRLAQADAAGNVQATLEVVPDLAVDDSIVTGALT